MDAQQELFTHLKLNIEALGYAVYDSELPPEDTPYPFVYLGDFEQDDKEIKSGTYGTVSPMIHVWHNDTNQRGTVSEMLRNIKLVCRQLKNTPSYAWTVFNIKSRIITDKTTKAPLLHGVIHGGEWYFFS